MREGWKSASRAVQVAIAMSLNGDEGDKFMMVGGRDLRAAMTKTEREAFVRGVARLAQNNCTKLIEGMSEQVGEELRGVLVKQQEQLENQQGRIKQLEDLIATMGGNAGGRRKDRDEAGDARSAEAETAVKEGGGEGDAAMGEEGGPAEVTGRKKRTGGLGDGRKMNANDGDG
jgi:hypothetical protein